MNVYYDKNNDVDNLELYERSRENLDELIKWFNVNNAKRNESTTRLHLIDDIIYKCLNWKKESITTEDSYDGEYTDYTFHHPRPIAILEAKREGNYFELALGTQKTVYSLKTLCKDNPKFKEAIRQVSGYCQKRGIQIGIVSNGWQFVGFIANRADGIPPLDGKAFVFPSIDYISQNYLEFWNAFSPDGIKDFYIGKVLLGSFIPKLPPKLSSNINRYPGIKNRNPFQLDLASISELVLEDVIRDENIEKDFLRECYCQSGALSQYSLLSKNILKTRYEFMFEDDDKKLALSQSTQKKGIAKDLKDTFSNSLSRRPILLVGDVGAGKSSFIRNLMKIDAENIFKNSISLLINLGSEIVIAENMKEAIINQITEKLRLEYDIDIEEDSFIRGAYYSDLQRLRTTSIYKSYFTDNNPLGLEKEINLLEEKIGNKGEHLKNSLNHLSKARKKQVIIFIDNCDQREFEDQEKAFLVAQEIAEKWNATIFVTLRPETFHKSSKDGALSGYHPKAFTIAPPRIDEVLKKRLNFAKKITRGEIQLSSVNMKLEFSRLEILINVFLNSLEINRDLLEFLDNISMGNTRLAIDFVKKFFGSGHVDTKKIIDIYDNDGFYLIPIHEFFRAITFGDNKYFDPESSPIPNVFDIRHSEDIEHFLLPILLSILFQKISKSRRSGYIETDKIFEHLQAVGYIVPQINKGILAAHKKNLIETSEKGTEINAEAVPSMLRITSMGAYTIETIINDFTYLDSIIVDTPITDKKTRSKVHNVSSIKDRIERVEIFCKYLSNVWDKIKDKETFFEWNIHLEKINKKVLYIKTRV